jgi:hypothetical protein
MSNKCTHCRLLNSWRCLSKGNGLAVSDEQQSFHVSGFKNIKTCIMPGRPITNSSVLLQM